jgi:hypothetical protein
MGASLRNAEGLGIVIVSMQLDLHDRAFGARGYSSWDAVHVAGVVHGIVHLQIRSIKGEGIVVVGAEAPSLGRYKGTIFIRSSVTPNCEMMVVRDGQMAPAGTRVERSKMPSCSVQSTSVVQVSR